MVTWSVLYQKGLEWINAQLLTYFLTHHMWCDGVNQPKPNANEHIWLWEQSTCLSVASSICYGNQTVKVMLYFSVV